MALPDQIQLLGYKGGTDEIFVKLPDDSEVLISEAAELYENVDGSLLSMDQFPSKKGYRKIPFLSYIPVRRK